MVVAPIRSTTPNDGQRPTAPVLCDVAEHAVLYLVPFRCDGRIVAHYKGQVCGVGKFLKLDLPQPDAAAIGAAAIGRDHQPVGRRVSLLSHHLEPAMNAVDGELRRVVIDADAHIVGIGANVVYAIGNGFAQFLVDEVMHIHFIRASFAADSRCPRSC